MLLCTAANGFAAVNLTDEHPITYGKEKQTVSFLAEVNGKYFYQPTRHFAIYEKVRSGHLESLPQLWPQTGRQAGCGSCHGDCRLLEKSLAWAEAEMQATAGCLMIRSTEIA